MPDIYVTAEYRWTCQECLTSVVGFDSAEEAKSDSENHKCEDYES